MNSRKVKTKRDKCVGEPFTKNEKKGGKVTGRSVKWRRRDYKRVLGYINSVGKVLEEKLK